jgi:hypothetical protein
VGVAAQRFETLAAGVAADGLAQALRHLEQQLVAHRVAHGVVEQLEIVQVDEQQRPEFAAVGAVGQRLGQLLGQVTPVGQAGERVEIGQFVDALVGQLAFGEVRVQARNAQRLAVGVA